MKFDSDCMKVICKYIEEHLKFSQPQRNSSNYFSTNEIPFEEILDTYSVQNTQYTREEILYILKILIELEYIKCTNNGGSDKYYVIGFTQKGYEFLLYKIHKFN